MKAAVPAIRVRYEKSCQDEPRKTCTQTPRQECHKEVVPLCKSEPREICVPKEKCKSWPKKNCGKNIKKISDARIGIGFPNWESGLIDLTILFKQIRKMVVVYAHS